MSQPTLETNLRPGAFSAATALDRRTLDSMTMTLANLSLAGSDALDRLTPDVRAATAGDRDAFGRLVESTKTTVCSIALAIVGDVEASQDIAQEVFLAAWRGLGSLRNPSSFLPWIRQTTRHRARTWLRDHSRRHRVSPSAPDEVLDQAVDPRPGPAEATTSRERKELLERALSDLPDESREVVILYYREGRSVAQVAQLLDLRPDAVKQRLSRARRALRRSVEERLAGVLVSTLPGAAFTGTVLSGLAAPSASAAVVSAAGASTGKTLAAKLLGAGGGTLLGAVASVAGIVLGLRGFLARATDEVQRRRLRRFRATTCLVAVVSAAALGLAAMQRHAGATLGIYALSNAALWGLYLGWLPRILGLRTPDERRQHRRQMLIGLLGGGIAGLVGVLVGLGAAGLL